MPTGAYRRDGITAGKRKYHQMTGAAKVRPNAAHYIDALANPFTFTGEARIPDLAAYPTNTSTVQLEVTQPAFLAKDGVTSICGGALVLTNGMISYCPEIAQVGVAATLGGQSSDGQFKYYAPGLGGNNSPNTYKIPDLSGATTVNSSHTINSTANFIIPGLVSLNAQQGGIRLVGAGLRVEFIGNDTNNQGLISGCYVTSNDVEQYAQNAVRGNAGLASCPFFTEQTNLGVVTEVTCQNWQTPITSQSAMENFRNNYSGAAKDGIELVFSPVDDIDMKMGPGFDVTMEGFAQSYQALSNCTRQPYGGPANISVTSPNGCSVGNQGLLQWHATGLATPGTGVQFRVYVVCHLEFLEKNDNETYDKPKVSLHDQTTLDVCQLFGINPVACSAWAAGAQQKATFAKEVFDKVYAATSAAQRAAIMDAAAKAFEENTGIPIKPDDMFRGYETFKKFAYA